MLFRQEEVMKKTYAPPALTPSGKTVADTLGPRLPNADSQFSGIAVGTVGFNL